jgi:hypothetical protein
MCPKPTNKNSPPPPVQTGAFVENNLMTAFSTGLIHGGEAVEWTDPHSGIRHLICLPGVAIAATVHLENESSIARQNPVSSRESVSACLSCCAVVHVSNLYICNSYLYVCPTNRSPTHTHTPVHNPHSTKTCTLYPARPRRTVHRPWHWQWVPISLSATMDCYHPAPVARATTTARVQTLSSRCVTCWGAFNRSTWR